MIHLTLCLLGNFACFFVVCRFFSKSTFLENSFKNTIRVSNSLESDQARQIVQPDLGPNCLHRLSADDSRQRPGRVWQSVTCLTADTCLTAYPRVSSLNPTRSHTFVEIDHEIISPAILLPSADSRRVVVI